jgi:hypothetical protein
MTRANLTITNFMRDPGTLRTCKSVPNEAPYLDEALYTIARDNGSNLCLTDYRGRRFVTGFYVDDAPALRRLGASGHSAGGAVNLVAWPKADGRVPNGNRVRNG